MKKLILNLVFCILTLISFAQKGTFCDENNWFRINFIFTDSITIVKPFYYAGHLPAYGYGKYEIKNDSLLITYTLSTDTTYYYTTSDIQPHNDSIYIVFIDDERPITLSYTQNTNKWSEHILQDQSSFLIERRNEDLLLDYGVHIVSIPTSIIMDRSISAVNIKLGEQSCIKEKKDIFYLAVKNDSEIIIDNKLLKKCNCNKPSTPIF